ncbi:hypothetical protein EYZ11_006743 [Aspergillus tanneri]|uniref:Arrestin C-terminal-like domain-containing protein n=1 Tax=Aspergillus tanneri TaxID=1220188 RepID=A0A4S3JEN1_9EURO|nr:uncharacterized protein ATNIH1004_007206 [Aspergillus tanneri]KAA8645786.1 hypothetical protein ATNIH1004_007206 [Aspergillus tanneri]THC93766.1 hypothetical protein EYZ11_006743 [Aspergillus tanneri]
MEGIAVQLSCPASHMVYFDSDGELYGDPLSGSIRLSGHNEIPPLDSLQVSLVRTIRLRQLPSAVATRRTSWIKDRLALTKSKRNSRHVAEYYSSFEQEVLRCNLSLNPASSTVSLDGTLLRDFEFALSSPTHTPETILSGSLVEVSYELVACATTTTGHILTDSQPLQLIRLKIPDLGEIMTHTRSFPESPVKAQLAICPQLSSPDSCRRYTAQVELRNIALPAKRASEVTLLVAESVSWHVDEIVQWDPKNGESGITHSRTLASGICKGRWTAPEKIRASISDDTIRQMKITVPFEILIDSKIPAVSDIDERSPGDGGPSLSVHHELTVDIVTGRETVSRDNGSLVARKNTVRGFGVTVLIPVYSCAETSDIMSRLDMSLEVLPGYEKVSMAPPAYREVDVMC